MSRRWADWVGCLVRQRFTVQRRRVADRLPARWSDETVIWEDKIMNCSSVLTMMAIGVIGFCASSIARADEVLKFRMFVHGTSIQTQEVGDVDGHILAVGRFSGQAAFSDGSVGTATLNFTSEYGEHVKGVGTISHILQRDALQGLHSLDQSRRNSETRGHHNRFSRGTSHCGRRYGKV